MIDGETKIGSLQIMFLSVQLVETGKAISVRQEPSRTDLERKYYPGLLEIEVPSCRLPEIKIIHTSILLFSERGSGVMYRGEVVLSNASLTILPAETMLDLTGDFVHFQHLTTWK